MPSAVIRHIASVSAMPAPRTPHLGRRIKVARETLSPEMTQADLGIALGVAANHVSRIERGLVKPPAKAYAVLVRVLKKPREYFIDEPLDAVTERDGGYPHLRLLMQSDDWRDATPEARAYVQGLTGSHGDMSLSDWLAELESADKLARRGIPLTRTPDAEEDVVDDPDEGGKR